MLHSYFKKWKQWYHFTDPVNGDWSNWTEWTGCSHSCGVGVRTRSRMCDSPAPQHGGHACVGESQQLEACNTEACPGMLTFV